MENGVVISTNKLVRKFRVGRTELVALKEVTLEFRRGEFAGLVGPSGSGSGHMGAVRRDRIDSLGST